MSVVATLSTKLACTAITAQHIATSPHYFLPSTPSTPPHLKKEQVGGGGGGWGVSGKREMKPKICQPKHKKGNNDTNKNKKQQQQNTHLKQVKT